MKKILFLFLLLLCTQILFAARYQEYDNGSYFITDQTIQGYSSNYSGGAVKITQTADLTIDNSIFYNNKTYYIVSPNDTNGGAVFNEGNLYFNTNNYSAFLYNTATEPSSCGGAIYNAANAQVYAVFENNTAPYGGAVFNEGNLEILADADGNVYNFSSNVASTHTYSYDGQTYGGYAGAVFNSSVTTTGNRVLFHDNSSSLHGGAIYNVGTDSIFNIGSNNLFYENHSSSGGAISVNSGRINISNNVVFATNTATKAGGAMYVAESALVVSSSTNIYGYNNAENGGAIYNEGRVILGTLESTEASAFLGNKATIGGAITNTNAYIGFCDNILFSQNSAEIMGGAFFNNNANSSVFFHESRFENNSANMYGGAIVNSSSTISFHKRAEFENNTAGTAGGAIINSNGSDSNIDFYSNAIFTNNSVTDKSSAGGAILNGKDSTVKFHNGAIFTNNSATSYGGAIANSGTIELYATITGDVEFTGNIANGVSNAIYDEGGTINLKTYSANIIFNDSVASADDTSILNIDCYDRGKVLLNEDMNGYTGFVNLNYGSLEIKEGKKFFNTDKFTIYNGTFTANANSILKGFGNINGFVHLTGGTNNSSITGDGKTIIDGNVVNNSFLGNSILINENKQLETSASNLLQEIENRGNLILNAGNLDINSTITGAGTLFISGDVKSYKTINQSSVTVSQKLTNYNKIQTAEYINNGTTINSSTISATRNFVNDGSLTNTNLIETEKFVAKENGTVDNTGTIKTKILNIAENAVLNNGILNGFEIQSYIDNEGTLTFENGTINNIIKGTGNTIINGNIVNNGQVSETNLTINNGKELETNVSRIIKNDIENNGNLILKGNSYLTDNMNFIQGTGTTIIDDYIVNMSTISNKVTINEDKFLRSDADDINGNITNNGQLAFNYTGTNKNIITGTGTLFIEGVISNDNNIEQDYSRIFSDKELKNNSTIKTNKIFQIDSNAKVINDGELLISSGTNNGQIERTNNSSQTKIYGNFVNNGTIDQFEFYVRESGKVQNNNTISADIIGNYGNLETSATNIAGSIINNGTLLFNTGAANNNYISGSGKLNITANNFTNNDRIEQKTIEISNNNNNVNFANSQLNAQQELNKFVNNSKIKSENLNLKSVNLKLTEKGILETENLFAQNSEMDFANSILQQHNFKSINLTDNLNLSVDADLENKQMDTIYANGFTGNGKINVKAINIVTDAKEEETEVVFTTSTVLKDKITSLNTINSKLFKYDVNYNKDTGNFNFLLTAKANPVIAESAIASSVGGFATQANVLGQVFASIDTQISVRHQAKQKGTLYASASSSIFDMENKIERGLWIRPYAVQETVKFNDIDVDNTAIGTLAGLDLAAGENTLLSFYLGYAGSNQKYEDIKVNQTGYIVGATGMIIKEKWYAGLTANINFNKAESQSNYGTDNFNMNMYSIGAKAGYNFDLSDKWILEPNLTLMYGNVNSQEYETTQGAKIDSQSTANITVEPQVKAKLSLDNGWQPYGLLGYVANISDKAKVVVDGTEFETDKIDGYVEYGAGVNKDFINTPWSCYLQATGRSGGRTGFAGNLGVKYRF